MTSRTPAVADSPRSPINVAARRSGLTAHVIRAWERRYNAITPDRSGSARRQFSDWEIQRLVLLRQAIELGNRIGEIANLSMEELYALVGRDTVPGVEASPRIPLSRGKLVEVAVSAAAALDSSAFLQALLQGTRTHAVPDLFEEFVIPMLAEIAARCRDGRLSAMNEHFAATHLRTFLGDLMTSSSVAPTGPVIVVTTPIGQQYELDALMCAITAMRAGWQAIFLGPNLPAEEIARAVEVRNAMAVSLSVSRSSDDARLPGQLAKLRTLLAEELPVFIGGAAAREHASVALSIRARLPVDLRAFSAELGGLRARIATLN